MYNSRVFCHTYTASSFDATPGASVVKSLRITFHLQHNTISIPVKPPEIFICPLPPVVPAALEENAGSLETDDGVEPQ